MAGKKSIEEKTSTELPEISFTVNEVKGAVDFLNFISSNARFNVSAPDMQKYISFNNSINSLVKRCQSHVFEIVKHEKATK